MKPTSVRSFALLAAFLMLSLCTSAHMDEFDKEVRFTENAGQWNSNILYRLRFKTGALFLEKDKLTFTFIDGDDWEEIHHAHHGSGADSFSIDGHAWYVRFAGANPAVRVDGIRSFSHYENYFIGRNPSKWRSRVSVYEGVKYTDIYPNIDLVIEGKDNKLKYSFIIRPGGDVNNIRMLYEGLNSIGIANGKLEYTTSFNTVYEEAPYTYQMLSGTEKHVASQFTLRGNQVGFKVTGRYIANMPIVIDPTFVFGTFTGSLADNFGYTATYDNQGNFYAGGIAREAGYPTTPGAFQLFFAGGAIVGLDFDQGYDADISITKYNPTGTALLYSTYIGGTINEQPHSLIVNGFNELLIYGRSNSSNYPTSLTGYDRTLNGTAMDIIVSKLNTTGTALLASTYIGGSGDDGVNGIMSPRSYGALKVNYADDARGEINVDAQNNVYVTSSTKSTNFPVTAGAFQTTFRGVQDACVFKMNNTLSTLIFSTYLGGTSDDAGYGIFLDSQNQPYVCGGTASTNFPTTAGALNTTYRGGTADGYIVRLNANATALLSSSYIGTTLYDQTHFVQLDAAGNVYLTGQTAGSFPVSGGVYSNANGGQYIISLSPTLNTIRFSTRFGKGDGNPDLSPTAFLVDACNNIYFSGWGGAVNTNVDTDMRGLPVTADAIKSTTELGGGDFYFFIVSRNAQSLVYASYFGGPFSQEHVDGGTSRFDRNGVIYQAACAGCGGNSDFPSTPGVWSQFNNSFNCNEGAAKIEFELIGVEVAVRATPVASGCAPLTVTFDGQPVNVIDYSWTFGDGGTSTAANPTHTFANPGTYNVRLIGVNSTDCPGLVFADTSSLTVTVFANPVANAGQDASVCSGNSAQLTATGGGTYRWSSNNQTTQSITVSPVVNTTYTVTVTNANGCTATDNVVVQVRNNVSNQRAAAICNGDSLFAGGAFRRVSGVYRDTFIAANGCDSLLTTNLQVLADTTINVNVSICDGDSFFAAGAFQTVAGQYPDTLTAADGCDSVVITNLAVLPNVQTTANPAICSGQSYFAGGALQTTSGTYFDTLTAANGCDSIVITNLTVNPNIVSNVDFTICNEDSFFVGGAFQNTTGTYFDTLTTAEGCDSVVVTTLTVRPLPVTTINAEICDGQSYPAGGGLQTTTGTYFDTLADINGCDSIIITNLTVNLNLTTNVDITICNEDSFFVGGVFQNTSGVYFDTLVTASGCDSIIVTALTVLPLPVTTIDAEICDGASYPAGGGLQTTAGTYFDTLTDANGCDSIIITNLLVNPNFTINLNVTICNEDSFFVGGAFQNTTGVYFDSLSTGAGCDSVIVTNLTVLPLPVTTINAEICDGESYPAGGASQTTAGSYFDTLTDVNGCDSIIITNLVVNPNFTSNVDVIICNEDSFFVGGAFQNTTGVYFDSLATAAGCDSVIITNLTVRPPVVTVIDTQVCDGIAYFAGGDFQTTSGTYYDTLKTSVGCDSLVITNLVFSPAISLSFNTVDATCFGACNASIEVVVTGGQAPLSYGWSNGGNNAQITNLCAASYSVTVTDLNGCTASGSTAVGEPTPLTATLTHDDIHCNCVNPIADFGICVIDFAGLPHGTVLNDQYAAFGIHISGDVANNTALDKVIVFNSNVSGSADSDLQVNIGNLSILPQNLVDANGDGLIDSPDDNADGGKQIFTFDPPRDIISFKFVDNESPNAFATAYDAQGNVIKTVSIPAAGNASVQTVNVNAQAVSRLVFDYTGDSGGLTEIELGCSFQCCDGWAAAQPAGGTPPYTYIWSDGTAGDSLTNLCAGTYAVTITDANGCSLVDSVTIDDFEEIQISVTVQDMSANCSANANQLCVLNFSDLPAGTKLNNQYAQYGVHISGDAYGTNPDQLIVFNADAPNSPDPDLTTATGHLAIFPENLTDNNNDGLVDNPNDQGNGGKMTFTFDEDKEVISFIFVDKERNSPGTAKAYDANNNLIKTVAIPNAGDGSVQTVMVNATGVRKLVIDYRDSGGLTELVFGCVPLCCDGSASASAVGGNPPFTFEWSNGATSASIDSLCPGTYTVTVTDADDCESVATVDVFDCSLSISDLTLVRIPNGDAATLSDGMVISLDTLCSFNIRANLCNATTGSVKFLLNGAQYSIENTAPFALAGDNSGTSYRPWSPAAGAYTLVAIPYSEENAEGDEGRPFEVNFTVVGSCALKTGIDNFADAGLNVNVYPVPFKDELNVDMEVAQPASGRLRVTDLIGREVFTQDVDFASGRNTFSIPFSGQTPTGVYFLEVRKGEAVKVIKIMKD